MRLKGKAALVTGAGQGFGFGIAEAFVREGARVACLDLKSDIAEAAAKRFGASALAVHADVSNRADVERAAQAAIEAFGRVDIVVNNAGTTHRNKPLMEVEEAEFDRIFAVNVKSILLTAQAFVPHMRAQRAAASSSMSARPRRLRPRPGLTVYNASKGAVHVMTKSMAVELAPDKIRVCALAPVAGETPLLAMFMGEDTPEKRAAFKATVPLGRFSTPQDIGHGGALSRQRRGELPDRRRARGRRGTMHLSGPRGSGQADGDANSPPQSAGSTFAIVSENVHARPAGSRQVYWRSP